MEDKNLELLAKEYAKKALDAFYPTATFAAIEKAFMDGYRKGANDRYAELTTKRSHDVE